MKLRVVLFILACAGICRIAPQAWSQSVAVTWPLTANQAANSSSNLLITGNPEAVSGGSLPTVSVFDYWSGQAQRLYAGTMGWIAGSVNANRYLQFDVHPTPLNQLNVTQVRFQYGGEHNVAQIIRADVRISTNNWTTWTVLSTGLVYPANVMGSYLVPVSVPAIPAGGTFSLRILPYAVGAQNAGTPTFAAHSNVQIIGTNTPVGSAHIRLQITKSTGSTVVPGNYPFNVTCTGPNGPYTGTNPVIVPLPGSGIDVQVPQNDTCTLNETPISGWGQPIWGGSTAPIVPNGWSAQIGPMPVNTPLIVTNQPPATAGFSIQKQFQGPPVNGTYTFHISCTGAYTGPSTIQLTVPPNPSSTQIQVPVNATCTISEDPVGGWNPPLWGGSSQPLNPNGWSVTMGPFHPTGGPGDRVQVTNRP